MGVYSTQFNIKVLFDWEMKYFSPVYKVKYEDFSTASQIFVASTVAASTRIVLLSETGRSDTLFTEWLLFLLEVLTPVVLFVTVRCMIRTGMPAKSKSSFKDRIKNLSSVSESCFFPLTKATNVGGRAFT